MNDSNLWLCVLLFCFMLDNLMITLYVIDEYAIG